MERTRNERDENVTNQPRHTDTSRENVTNDPNHPRSRDANRSLLNRNRYDNKPVEIYNATNPRSVTSNKAQYAEIYNLIELGQSTSFISETTGYSTELIKPIKSDWFANKGLEDHAQQGVNSNSVYPTPIPNPNADRNPNHPDYNSDRNPDHPNYDPRHDSRHANYDSNNPNKGYSKGDHNNENSNVKHVRVNEEEEAAKKPRG